MLKNKKDKKNNIEQKNFQREMDLAIGNTMERYGDASAQHFKAYPELKKISNSKVHPDFKKQNLQQQSGFSAEVKQEARENAEAKLKGSNKTITRTNNNDRQFDHIKSDTKGGIQQKNLGKVENYDKLLSGKNYEKYKKAEEIIVPSDQYDDIKNRWGGKRESLEKQERSLHKNGKTEEADTIKEEIKKIKDVSKRLKEGKVSTKEAREARTNHVVSTAKDIGRISHKAGVEAAKTGAVIEGAMSAVRNTKALIDGEKDIGEAAKDIAIDTTKGAASSYGNAAATSVIRGALKSSTKQVLKNLAKKNGPVMILSAGKTLAKQTYKLMSGKITLEQYTQNIGKEGFLLASSAIGASIGSIVPGLGTVVGGFIGGMVASFLSGATYNQLMKTIQDTKLSDERRRMITEYCKKLKEEEIRYREEMIQILNEFFEEKETTIRTGFETISMSLVDGKSISSGLEQIADAFNIELAFSSREEFSKHLKKNRTLEI